MTDHYSDFEELRPLGETTHVPDDGHSGRGNTERAERKRKEGLGSYLDRVRLARGECSSCSASIPANRTKCRFCLSNHLDGTSDDSHAPRILSGHYSTSYICSSRRRRSMRPSRRVLLRLDSSRRLTEIQRSMTASRFTTSM